MPTKCNQTELPNFSLSTRFLQHSQKLVAGLLLQSVFWFLVPDLYGQDPSQLDAYIQTAKEAIKPKENDTIIKYAQLALESNTPMKYPTKAAVSHTLLGIAFKNIAIYDYALREHMEALAIYDSIQDQAGMAKAYSNIGVVFDKLGNHEMALRNFRKCFHIRQELGYETPRMISTLQNLALAYQFPESEKMTLYYDSSRYYHDQVMQYWEEQDDSFRVACSFQNIGTWFAEQTRYDSAVHYLSIARVMFAEMGFMTDVVACMGNIGAIELKRKQTQIAIEKMLQPAYQLVLEMEDIDQERDITLYLSEAYRHLNEADSALKYLTIHKQLDDSLFNERQARELSALETLHQVSEQARRNEKLFAENRQLLLSLIIAMILIGALGWIYWLNRRRLKVETRLSEEKQATLKADMLGIMRQQEVRNMKQLMDRIDVERERIANSLHHRLGSILLTTRLNLHNFKQEIRNHEIPALNSLNVMDAELEQAIKSVRAIAHDMRVGVMAELGLISATRNLADAIQSSKVMKVNFRTSGMSKRLPSELEATCFELVQELVTNVIKHAEASKLEIQYIQYEEEFVINLEDNGKGFDREKMAQRKVDKGMGLSAIEKQIQALNGEFIIDTQPGRGTSILIELPLQKSKA